MFYFSNENFQNNVFVSYPVVLLDVPFRFLPFIMLITVRLRLGTIFYHIQ